MTEVGDTDDAPRVVLVDEEGVERSFLLHDALDVDGHTYYLVEADEVLLLKETGAGLESVGGAELDRVLAVIEAEE